MQLGSNLMHAAGAGMLTGVPLQVKLMVEQSNHSVLACELRPLTLTLFSERSDQYDSYLFGAIACRAGLKQFDEARRLADRRCELTKDLYGCKSANYGEALWQSGDLLRAQNKIAEAVAHYEEAKLLMPKDCQNYGSLINSLAVALRKLEKYEQALALSLIHI